MEVKWKAHIVSTSDVLRGKPRLKDTRIPVSLVLLKPGTFFTFAYFACGDGLAMIIVLYAETIPIRYPRSAASYYCQGERKTDNL